MKKLFSIVAFLAVAMTASAQLSFGVRGGLNVVDMSLSSDVLKSENKAGWFIGPTVKLNIPVINLGVDASALYDQRTAEVKGAVGSETIKRQAINVPINLRYGIGLGEMAEIFLKGGPQFGFNIGDKNYDLSNIAGSATNGVGTIDCKQEYKSSEFSVNLGAGVMLLGKLEIAANYNIVCGKTGEVSTQNVVGAISKEIGKSRTNAWQISAAYYF